MRFVVVEIPDNEEAEAFVEAIKNGYVMYSKPHPTVAGEYSINKPLEVWNVPAVFAVPTKFCECPDYEGKSVRSKKFGWNVHAKCAKPRATVGLYPNNLLEVGATVKERVYFMSFRADRKSPWGVSPGGKYDA
jgi:hypothetical protein